MLRLRHVLIQSGQPLPVLVERLEMGKISGEVAVFVGKLLNRLVVWFLVGEKSKHRRVDLNWIRLLMYLRITEDLSFKSIQFPCCNLAYFNLAYLVTLDIQNPPNTR